jgi:2-amino-4-hydroxy-6-hydroxymethyldihydropteridine diphosphokinase
MVDSALKPESLILVLKNIEKNLGRNIYKKNSSRTCDLDILLVQPGSIKPIRKNISKCILPHPRIHEREFVLKPMMDICPNWMHPRQNQRICDIYKSINTGEKLYKIGKKL